MYTNIENLKTSCVRTYKVRHQNCFLPNVPFLPGSKVDFDVNKDHDAGGDVEGAKGRIHHVTRVTAQLW